MHYSAVSPDGRWAFGTGNGFEATILDLHDGSTRTLPGHTRYTSSVEISTDGIAVLADSITVRVIDLASAKVIATLRMKGVRQAFMLQPGVLVMLVNDNVELYDVAHGTRIGEPLQKNVHELAVSPLGVIATASWTTSVSATLWSSRTDARTVPVPATNTNPGSDSQWLRFSPDGSRLGYFSSHTLHLVDVARAEVVYTLATTGLCLKRRDWILLSPTHAVAITEPGGGKDLEVASLDATSPEARFEKLIDLDKMGNGCRLGPAGVLVAPNTLLAIDPPVALAPRTLEWVDPALLVKRKPKKATAPKNKPILCVPAPVLAQLRNQAPLAAILAEHVVLEPLETLEKEGRALAEATAGALEGLVLSTSIDAEYVPCVLQGADPKGAHVKNRKASKKLTAAAFLHDIENLESLADYVGEADQVTYGEAAKLLEDVSPVRQIRLADETESFTVLLVLARTETSSPGVMSFRIDT